MKIATHLDHISHCKATPGMHPFSKPGRESQFLFTAPPAREVDSHLETRRKWWELVFLPRGVVCFWTAQQSQRETLRLKS
jgi:hypothetical protein